MTYKTNTEKYIVVYIKKNYDFVISHTDDVLKMIKEDYDVLSIFLIYTQSPSENYILSQNKEIDTYCIASNFIVTTYCCLKKLFPLIANMFKTTFPFSRIEEIKCLNENEYPKTYSIHNKSLFFDNLKDNVRSDVKFYGNQTILNPTGANCYMYQEPCTNVIFELKNDVLYLINANIISTKDIVKQLETDLCKIKIIYTGEEFEIDENTEKLLSDTFVCCQSKITLKKESILCLLQEELNEFTVKNDGEKKSIFDYEQILCVKKMYDLLT